MGRFTLTREFYVPKGATKVADKQSDAVAYLYESLGKPAARVFYGKQAKPVWHYSFRTPEGREKAVREAFEARRRVASLKAERAAERKAYVSDWQVGDILNTCWGYDQTNREFFEVVELRGKMLVLREIAQVHRDTGPNQWQCMPQSGQYIGAPIRRLAQKGSIRIDDVRWAHKWNTSNVAGVPMGAPVYASDGH